MEDLAPQEEATKTPNTGRNLKRKRTAKKKGRRLRPAKSADQTGDCGSPDVGKSTLTNRILGEERVVVYACLARRVTVSTFQWNATDVSCAH